MAVDWERLIPLMTYSSRVWGLGSRSQYGEGGVQRGKFDGRGEVGTKVAEGERGGGWCCRPRR